MDKDKELRLVAATIIFESNVSKAGKLQLLNFIKEQASDVQIKALLLDGRIVSLDKQAEEIVNARFEQSSLNEEAWVAAAILGATVTMGGSAWLVWRSIKAMFSAKARRCDAFSVGIKRKACYIDIDIQRLKKTIELIKKQKSGCSKAKDPKKCIAMNNDAVSKLQAKLVKKQQKAQKYINKNPKKASAGKENAKRDEVVTAQY